MQILYFMTLNACIASHHIVWVFCPLCTCLHFAASCADDGGRGGALCYCHFLNSWFLPPEGWHTPLFAVICLWSV